MKKQLEGTALEHLPGLMCPGPCKPMFQKNNLLANLFLLPVAPQSVINLHWVFNLSNRNTHFDMFLKIKACKGVIYFLICVRKHESNLPTNIRTTAGEENTMIYRKMRPFEWNHISALFYDSVVCFLLPKCVFTNGVCHVFHQNIMFLYFL